MRQQRLPPATSHADFCNASRSTNLDSWTLSQLRTMKVGGNAAAAEFFTRHGGSNLLGSSDGKSKYSSDVAKRYLTELEKRKKEDERRLVR